MSVIDLDKYLAPVSADDPSGPDLEFDTAFAALETLAKGRAEQQFGDTVIAAEEPDWREVRGAALELLGRTRDLRVGVLLTRALVHSDGYPGLADGLALLHGWLEGQWDTVNPRLDPDDGDPIFRTNALTNLNSYDTTIKAVREAPVVSARMVGRFGYRDWMIATDKLPKPASMHGDAPTTAMIEAAFNEVPVEEIQATELAIGRAFDAVTGIETAMTSRVGTSKSVTLGELKALLKSARQLVAENLARRGVGSAEAVAEAGGSPAGGGAVPVAVPGQIRSRDDVVKMLDRCVEYFQKNEPSSPVPILLQRAKRLTHKTFFEIINDLAPDGLHQVEKIRGPEE